MRVIHPQHIGEVVFFATEDSYKQFISQVRAAIELRKKEHEGNGLRSSVNGLTVRIEVLDNAGGRRYASEVESEPRPGFVVYLNEAASKMCEEARIEYEKFDWPNKAKPPYTQKVIEDTYWFRFV